jgi:DNA modification methylase
MSLGKNQLFYGDNYEVLQKYIKDESVDLVYIDPPFNSKRNYNQIYNNIGNEDKAQAQAFIDTWSWDDSANIGYEEIISNKCGFLTSQSIDLIIGLEKVLKRGSLFAYLISMTQRINEMWRVLKPTGSFYLHCDPTASHYLKLVCDAIFTSRGGDFRNEIIWYFYNKYAPAKTKFANAINNILFYQKSDKCIFNEIREKYEMPQKRLKRVNVNGVLKNAKDENGKTITYEVTDRKIDNVWRIPCLQDASKERLGYPTQKPEALLERIIKASSNEGDTILDAYCGCGTTVAVAQRLNRNWIGIDDGKIAIETTKKRLENVNYEFIELSLEKQLCH